MNNGPVEDLCHHCDAAVSHGGLPKYSLGLRVTVSCNWLWSQTLTAVMASSDWASVPFVSIEEAGWGKRAAIAANDFDAKGEPRPEFWLNSRLGRAGMKK